MQPRIYNTDSKNINYYIFTSGRHYDGIKISKYPPPEDVSASIWKRLNFSPFTFEYVAIFQPDPKVFCTLAVSDDEN